jgi:hypothetical protein
MKAYFTKILTVVSLGLVTTTVTAQTGINTNPYPASNNIGFGYTNTIGYKLTTHGNMQGNALEDPETGEFIIIPGVTPFRIIGKTSNPEEEGVGFSTKYLSEAFTYKYYENVDLRKRVYSLDQDGAMLLGSIANNNPNYTFNYSLITDNNIYSKGNLLTDSRIGVGTTNPLASIDLRNGSIALNENKLNLVDAGDPYHYLSFVRNFGSNSVYVDGPQLMGYGGGMLGTTNGGDEGVLFWKRSGRVGVNISNPSHELHVIGDVKFDGANADDELVFKSKSGYHSLEFNQLRFHEWGIGDVFTISSGRIGISQTSPSAKLDVNGDIKSTVAGTSNAIIVENSSINSVNFLVKGDGHVYAREVEVKMGAFPDYVFGEKYELMSLSNLREYINTENHLPGVKSAEEVAREGIGLGELSRIQMEKIEELTLYILQLEERLKKVEKQVR